jgi:hypothetical protein
MTLVHGRPHAEPAWKRGIDLVAVAEVLAAALSEISDQSNWCQGSIFVLRDGTRVQDPDDVKIFPHDAFYKWCSEGALYFATFWQGRSWKIALQAVCLLESYTHMPLADWNDRSGRSHEDVLELFRRALADIARARP